MANTTPSANMNMPVPVVGTQPGPQYAININDCLTILDGHTHTPGSGVQITTAALDINADLTIGGNNLINVLSTRFNSQSGVLVGADDIGCVYEVLNDLYFNDGTGVAIRLTQNGAVAGTPGSIANLVSPASVSYVSSSSTFVFQSNTNTSAYLDASSIIIRNLVANSPGLTLEAPTLSVDYTITLPTLPASSKILTIDATGAMVATLGTDNSTINIASNNLQVLAAGIVDGATTTAVSNQIVVRNGDREHNYELNGRYGGLTMPQSGIDAIFIAPYDITITSVWIFNGTAGASGTTEFDLKVGTSGLASGSYTSILGTTGKIASTAASGVWTDSNSVIGSQTGVTKPVVATPAMTAGQGLRFDLITAMPNAQDARIRIYYKQT